MNYEYLLRKSFHNLLLLNIHRVHVEGLVSEFVEPGEGDPEVGRLQQVLHLLAVRVEARRVDIDGGRQHSVDNLTKHAPRSKPTGADRHRLNYYLDPFCNPFNPSLNVFQKVLGR